ncbi:ATP-binding protein [Bifidobacterium sp. ESL0769]|uniref:AAA family ATPase n=1 Tax=Bifidobacterium sp. ESL0769 TaxID=2983229 RepID=UPI0023F982BB|nr:ATP-binding protein [Bifidobacterium sp. ESL0769]WEV67906.1 ATP-binding protein [Bifidobacterium sp. ESL0769]
MKDEKEKYLDEIVQLSRLGLEHKNDDLRMYVRRLVRRYQVREPDVASQLSSCLKNASVEVQDRSVLRSSSNNLLFSGPVSSEKPRLAPQVESELDEIVRERTHYKDLVSAGLSPVASAIFTGPPGVGKTMAGQWLSSQLHLPMYKLDLASAVSSRLGETGNNLQSVFLRASKEPSILFLDEIDSIAKTRADGRDIGEMKRLVTVLLQLLDMWDGKSIVLAATNNAELIDSAVWRRFELKIDFPMPSSEDLSAVLKKDMQMNGTHLDDVYLQLLVRVLNGESYSDARTIGKLIRKRSILDKRTLQQSTLEYAEGKIKVLPHKERIDIAKSLAGEVELKQREISEVTGVSRDTIRKFSKQVERRNK